MCEGNGIRTSVVRNHMSVQSGEDSYECFGICYIGKNVFFGLCCLLE